MQSVSSVSYFKSPLIPTCSHRGSGRLSRAWGRSVLWGPRSAVTWWPQLWGTSCHCRSEDKCYMVLLAKMLVLLLQWSLEIVSVTKVDEVQGFIWQKRPHQHLIIQFLIPLWWVVPEWDQFATTWEDLLSWIRKEQPKGHSSFSACK